MIRYYGCSGSRHNLERDYQQSTLSSSELGAKVIQEDEVENWVIERLENANILHK
jgi:hypothetical protein